MKIEISKIKIAFIKLLKVLANYTFLTFLVLLFLSLIFGTILWYKYKSLAQKEKLEVQIMPLQLKEDVFERVLKAWEERERRFKESEFKEYPSPFLPL